MSVVLTFDLGKTGCRAALYVDGQARAYGNHAGAIGCTDRDGLAQALAAMDSAFAGLRQTSGTLRTDHIDAVGAGLAGLASAPSLAGDLIETLTRRHRTNDVSVASDMTTSHLGVLRGEPGVVLTAGTGATALGVAATGEVGVCDGWGYLLGDAGSGFAIALAGLRLALRDRDGRGGSKRLADLATRRFGELASLPLAIHSSTNPPRTIAAFAPDVLAAARDGDPQSVEIWADAGRELATTVAAAARLAMPAATIVPVGIAGGLFDAGELLRAPFEVQLRRELPTADLLTRSGNALDGAFLMATRSDLPHASLIHRRSKVTP